MMYPRLDSGQRCTELHLTSQYMAGAVSAVVSQGPCWPKGEWPMPVGWYSIEM